MKRRDFIAIAGCAVATRPRAGFGQQPPRQPPRIAIAIPVGNAERVLREEGLSVWPGFFAELRRLGYVEGSNLVVERYSAEDQRAPEWLDEFAGNIVRRSPALIVTAPNSFVRRFAEKTKTIPIVGIMAEPVEYGLVASLAHPGGNLTGVSTNAGGEIWGKRLQLIKDVLPAASRLAYMLGPVASTDANLRSLQMLQKASEPLGVSVSTMSVAQSTEAGYRAAFAAIVAGLPDAIVVIDSAQVTPFRGLIAELASAHRVPAMFPFPDDVRRGALMGYGTDGVALGRQLAGQVAKILGGAKPADIPIEQASRFVFAINLKTAAAMGFAFPPAVLAQADEVIE